MRNVPKLPNNKTLPPAVSDGPAVKNPRYQGRTKTGESDIQRPHPVVSGSGPKKTPAQGNGYGPGGRFGRGGWQASAKRMKKNFLARTPEQEAESQQKQAMMEAKRKSAKTRLTSIKKGPNEKQSQLLGGE